MRRLCRCLPCWSTGSGISKKQSEEKAPCEGLRLSKNLVVALCYSEVLFASISNYKLLILKIIGRNGWLLRPHGQFLEIHRREGEHNGVFHSFEASIKRISHGVFLFGIGKHTFNRLTA